MVKTFLKKILFWPTSPFIAYLLGEPFFWYKGRRLHGSTLDMAGIKRVLVVRLDQIGDVVMTTPFLRELRGNLPNAWITLVVNPSILNLVENCPYVDEVLASDCKDIGDLGGWPENSCGTGNLIWRYCPAGIQINLMVLF